MDGGVTVVLDERGAHGTRAVVLGGSLAGLFTAAALARHVDRVVLVERDRLPVEPQWRRGVPQARHAHNLMTGGHRAMSRLLPGIRDELVAAGAVSVRMPEDMLLLTAGGWMPRFPAPLEMLTCSRELIDAVVLHRIRRDRRIEISERTEVVEPIAAPDGSAVRGVRVRTREPGCSSGWSEPRELLADLVVDATGRNSRAAEWLQRLGYAPPEDRLVDAQTAYATCVFAPPIGHRADWRCMLLQPSPQLPRQGIINLIEGGRWMVSLSALGGVRPPTDHVGFLEYARTLSSPLLWQALRDARPLTAISRSGRTENRRRFFERLRRWPDGYLVVGDAVCALNPSYGQGMSVAAQSAVALDEALTATGTVRGVAAGLRRVVARAVDPAWQIATNADLAYPWAPRDLDLRTRLAIRYLYRIIAVCPTSEAASRVLLDLNQLVAPPTAVFRPRVVAAVLRGPRRKPAGPPLASGRAAVPAPAAEPTAR
jgi:2-polyprenyl-6-methoxyphenol hydroxylase-like FAD-dependent oxidoreductase